MTHHDVADAPPAEAARGRALGWWSALVLAAVAGLAGGAATDVLQTPLAGSDWFILVNSGAPWLTVAFLVGLLVPARPWTAAAAGALTEAGLVLGYYATASLRGYPVASSSVTMWVLTGLVGGPVVAVGAAWLWDAGVPRRVLGLSVLGGIWVQEGIDTLRLPPESSYGAAGWWMIVFGLALPLVLGRSARDRLRGLLAVPPVVLVAYVVTGPVLDLVVAHV